MEEKRKKEQLVHQVLVVVKEKGVTAVRLWLHQMSPILVILHLLLK
jgi:hypothetical protein